MQRFIVWMGCMALFFSVQAQYSWVYITGEHHPDSAVDTRYIESLKSVGVEIIGTSKWFNAVCIQSTTADLCEFPFVDRVEGLRSYSKTLQVQEDYDFPYGNSDIQISMLGLDEYHKRGYTGKGVTIALFDAGFFRADTMSAFDSIWMNDRMIDYYDFVDKDTWLFDEDGHGRSVLSVAGGYWEDSIVGAAPRASFVLARTEDVESETHLEEYNWVKALEWADSIGVDIIHSSLGYSQFDTLEGDYTYWDMDGETTIITKAANIAVERGIFVTNSAGNEGDDPWKYITAPCDGKGVLCVGAVDSFGVHAPFSSFGPSSDGRVKPELMAMGKGTSFVTNRSTMRTGNGTSLSGPLIAGMVACLKEAWPDALNSQIFQAVIQSADRYENPDSAYGYGIPNVLKADSLLGIITSVDEVNLLEFTVFPNPSKGKFTVQAGAKIEDVHMYNLLGQEIPVELIGSENGASEVFLVQPNSGVYSLVVELEARVVLRQQVVVQ
jgi:serine protease AprX